MEDTFAIEFTDSSNTTNDIRLDKMLDGYSKNCVETKIMNVLTFDNCESSNDDVGVPWTALKEFLFDSNADVNVLVGYIKNALFSAIFNLYDADITIEKGKKNLNIKIAYSFLTKEGEVALGFAEKTITYGDS